MNDKKREKTMEKIIGWMKEDRGDERYVDLAWEVTRIEDTDQFVAGTEGLPFKIVLDFEKYFLKIVLYTEIETATMPNDERLKLFRDLLLINQEHSLMKFFIDNDEYGREENIGIRVDLDLATLGKEEFDDALGSLMIGAQVLDNLVGKDDDDDGMEKIIDSIADELLMGKTKKELIDELMSYGATKDQAVDIVEKAAEKVNLSAQNRYVA